MATEEGDFCREGLQFILEAAFSEEQAAPASFYVGLVEDATVDFDDNLAGLTELSGSGYSAQALASDAVDFLSATDGTDAWKVTTKEVTFTAAGGDWNIAKNAILKTSSDASGKLLGSMEINSGVGYVVADGQHIDIGMILKLVKPA